MFTCKAQSYLHEVNNFRSKGACMQALISGGVAQPRPLVTWATLVSKMSGVERARERGKSAETSKTATENKTAPVNVCMHVTLNILNCEVNCKQLVHLVSVASSRLNPNSLPTPCTSALYRVCGCNGGFSLRSDVYVQQGTGQHPSVLFMCFNQTYWVKMSGLLVHSYQLVLGILIRVSL